MLDERRESLLEVGAAAHSVDARQPFTVQHVVLDELREARLELRRGRVITRDISADIFSVSAVIARASSMRHASSLLPRRRAISRERQLLELAQQDHLAVRGQAAIRARPRAAPLARRGSACESAIASAPAAARRRRSALPAPRRGAGDDGSRHGRGFRARRSAPATPSAIAFRLPFEVVQMPERLEQCGLEDVPRLEPARSSFPSRRRMNASRRPAHRS